MPKINETVGREAAETGDLLVAMVMFIVLCVAGREIRTAIGVM